MLTPCRVGVSVPAGEGVGRRHLQLQLRGAGRGQSVRGLLGPGGPQRLHPHPVALQLLHPLQHGDPTAAAAQRDPDRPLLLGGHYWAASIPLFGSPHPHLAAPPHYWAAPIPLFSSPHPTIWQPPSHYLAAFIPLFGSPHPTIWQPSFHYLAAPIPLFGSTYDHYLAAPTPLFGTPPSCRSQRYLGRGLQAGEQQ